MPAPGYNPKVLNLKASESPKALKDVGVTERLGTQLDLSLTFKDEQGQKKTLGEFFSQGRPILMTLVYYSCPGLCNYHLNGLTSVFRQLQWTVGDQFDVVTVSFDASEGSNLATDKKANYLKNYGRQGADQGWHFLTADQATINQLSSSLGFRFKWDEKSKQWAHVAVAYVLTPSGKISRYLYGVGFEAETLRLSLVEASDGKVGTFLDQVLLFCFQYDPKTSKYTLYAYKIMQAGGGLIVFILAIFMIPFWRRQRSVRGN